LNRHFNLKCSCLAEGPKVGGDSHLEGVSEVLRDTIAPIFCEILESSTQKLIEEHPYMSTVCNVLASNKLIAKVLAMVRRSAPGGAHAVKGLSKLLITEPLTAFSAQNVNFKGAVKSASRVALTYLFIYLYVILLVFL